MIENEIIEAETQLVKALKENDSQQLDRLLHDHLIVIIRDGQAITKSIIIGAYISGSLQMEEVYTFDHEMSVIDDTVVMSGIVELLGTYMDQTLAGMCRFLCVWKQFGEFWKVIGGAYISVAGNNLDEEKVSLKTDE